MLCGPRNLGKKPNRGGQDSAASRIVHGPLPAGPGMLTLCQNGPAPCSGERQLSRFQHCETLLAFLLVLALHPPQYTEMNYQRVLSHAQPPGPNRFVMGTSPSLPTVP